MVPNGGQGVLVGRRSTIAGTPHGKLALGDGAWIGDDCEIGVLGVIRIGSGTSLQHRSQIHGDVDMGAGCVCAANLYIASTSHRFRDFPHLPIRWQDELAQKGQHPLHSHPVVIEDDCWLGINVVICPGVVVGRGTVVGANAVVTSNTPPYSVVAGAPARVVGQRLAFKPPMKLSAQRPEDIPYFYAGFSLPEKKGDSSTLSVGQGRWAERRFALALKSRVSGLIHLHLLATSPVKLLHGSQEVGVQKGASELILTGCPDERGLLWFSVLDWSPRCMAVQTARVGDEAVQFGSAA